MRRLVSLGFVSALSGFGCVEEHPRWDANDGSEDVSADESSGSVGQSSTDDGGPSDGTGDDGTTGSGGSGDSGVHSSDTGNDTGSATGSTGVDTGSSDTGTPSTSDSTEDCTVELCNGIDDDCDGIVDEVSPENITCDGCVLKQDSGRAYWLCSDTKNWDAARTDCSDRSLELVVVRDSADNDFLGSQHPTSGGTFASNFWIGLSDTNEEGLFEWIDGSPLNFASWAYGEPNDAGAGGEDCVEFYDVAPNVWNDRSCDATRPYVCAAPHS